MSRSAALSSLLVLAGPASRRTFIDLASSDEDPEDSQAAGDVHAEQPLPSQVPDTGMDSAEDVQRAAQDEVSGNP